MHINLLLRCIIQNSSEDAIIARWQDAGANLREETFSQYVFQENKIFITRNCFS